MFGLDALSAGRDVQAGFHELSSSTFEICAHKDCPDQAGSNTSATSEDVIDASLVLPPFLPHRVYRTALQELSQGGKQTLEKCLSLWRDGRLGLDMLTNFAKSISWQSPTLSRHFNPVNEKEETQAQELLSLADLEALKQRSGMKRARSSESKSCTQHRTGQASLVLPLPKRQCSPGFSHFDRMNAESALDIVNCTYMMDSSRTTKLGSIIRASPALEGLFASNGWDTKLKQFVTAPKWPEAKDSLLLAVGEEFSVQSPTIVETC